LELGLIGPGLALTASTTLEEWMYRHSGLITGQTDGIVENIRKRFPDTKVVLFPNGIDVDAYSGSLERDKVRAEYPWEDGDFVVGYTGVLGHAQALDQILDAAVLLADRSDVHFAFFGDGPRREHLERRIASEQIHSAKIYGTLDRSFMPHLQAALDAGVVPLAKGRLFEGARPSKMFEIMAAGRPVLLCANGEAVRIVNGAPGGAAGLVSPPQNPVALAENIRRLMTNRDEAVAMGQRGRRHVFESFDREAIARNLEEHFFELLATHRQWQAQ
jgi:glycosyltransferase involved in cell wall biosynthesis